MELNYKDIHIGSHIREISGIKQLSVSRACAFLKCSVVELERMYNLKSMDSELLLRWSKLLDYNFFMFYHSHLQLYKPSAATAQVSNSDTSDTADSYSFKKNVYSPELIDYLLEKMEEKSLSVKDIIERYNIPRTTIYRWLKKRKATKKKQSNNQSKEMISSNDSKKKINYEGLYLDFIDETRLISGTFKTELKKKIKTFDFTTNRDIYKLNQLIRANIIAKTKYTLCIDEMYKISPTSHYPKRIYKPHLNAV